MEQYSIMHTVDDGGARAVADEGWYVASTTDLDDARRVANRITQRGGAAYVRRESDRAVWLDDAGSWIDANGNEVA